MVQLLVIVGSIIFVLLGAAHGMFTLQNLGSPRNFTPRNAELLSAMQQSAVAFHPKLNLWRAWLGFHFSHSLGLLVFGGGFLYVGIFHSALFSRSPFLQSCSVLVPAIYMVISLNFWFPKPAIYLGTSLACFVLAAALSYL